MVRCLRLVLLWTLLLCLGCGSTPETAKRDEGRLLLRGPEDRPGLHHVLQVSPQIYSGGEPLGEDGFRSLAQLGVKTVVSVDGARPKVALARKHGLRYVHIPIGYDGVSTKAGHTLARLVREVDGPIYVHCHHGRHRGPAAAAVACIAAGDADSKQALKILEHAGTSKNYSGLWRDVQEYQPPNKDTQLPELVEVARVGSFAAAMAQIDRHYDHLKLCQKANWAVPPGHPDLVPAQEALMLREGLHESGRNLATHRGKAFWTKLQEAEKWASEVEQALRDGKHSQVTEAFARLGQSCKQCHARHRNGNAPGD